MNSALKRHAKGHTKSPPNFRRVRVSRTMADEVLMNVESLLKTEISKVETSLKLEISQVETFLKQEISNVETSVKRDFFSFENKITRQLYWINIVQLFAIVSSVFALIKFVVK